MDRRGSEGMVIKIVTWNMAYWSHQKAHDEAWAFLLVTRSMTNASRDSAITTPW